MQRLSTLSILNFLLFFMAVFAYQGTGSKISPLKPTFKKNLSVQNRLALKTAQESTVLVAEAPKPPKQLNAIELCLCGAFATAFGDFIMHPIDTIKITQQTATVAVGMLQTAKQIVASQGPAGLYQGVVPYLVGDGLSGAVKFATFEMITRFVEKNVPKKYHGFAKFLCAAVAMIASSVILVPGEILKTRLQAGAATSVVTAITSILQNEGIKGLYVGYYATLVRDVPYTMLELGIYENLKNVLQSLKKPVTLADGTTNPPAVTANDELIAAAITGGVASFLTTPLDLIKTKLMMQSSAGGKYAGVLDAMLSIYREGGLSALFVGSMARVAWLLPFTTIYLGIYEMIKRKLLAMKNTEAEVKKA